MILPCSRASFTHLHDGAHVESQLEALHAGLGREDAAQGRPLLQHSHHARAARTPVHALGRGHKATRSGDGWWRTGNSHRFHVKAVQYTVTTPVSRFHACVRSPTDLLWPRWERGLKPAEEGEAAHEDRVPRRVHHVARLDPVVERHLVRRHGAPAGQQQPARTGGG
jgi:hypothetical protein